MKIYGIFLSILSLITIATKLNSADSNPPEVMTYQGYLTDSGGDALGTSSPANYDVIFRIFDAKNDGAKVWTEQQTVTIDKGYFSVLLGEGSSFNNESRPALSEVFSGNSTSDKYLEITVRSLGGSDVKIAPRLRLVTSPYAFRANTAVKVGEASGADYLYRDAGGLNLSVTGTPILTLSDSGSSIFKGKVKTELPGFGTSLELTNGAETTTMGAQNGSYFHLQTSQPAFYFNAPIAVDGTISAYDSNLKLFPKLNPDNYVEMMKDANQIEVSTQQLSVKQGTKNVKIELASNSSDFTTSTAKFNFDKPVHVNGGIHSNGITQDGWIYRNSHNVGGLLGGYNNIGNNGQKSNPIYAIGSAYTPYETTLNNFYGIGYTHHSASFISGSANGWGLYLAADGDARTFLSAQAGDSYINRDGGRIGIGTSSPTETLDVNGTLRVTSYTYLRNRIYGSGGQYFYVNNAHDSGVEIVGHTHNNGRIGKPSVQWDDGYITELWASVQGSDRRLKKDIEPVEENQILNLINKIPFYQYRLRFNDDEKMASQGRDPNGLYFGLLAQELRKHYPNVVKSSGNYAELDENALDEETVRKNHWYVEKDRLAELALGGIKDLTALLEKKDAEIEALQSKTSGLETELKALKSQVAEILAERN